MSYRAVIDLTGTEPGSRFQDIAGTSPSTSRIGRARDLSGNGLDVAALDLQGRPKAEPGFALYDDYGQHRLASPAFEPTGAGTYVAVRFRKLAVNVSGNILIARGGDAEGQNVVFERGNDQLRFFAVNGTLVEGVTLASGDHTLEIWAGSPLQYSLDGGPTLNANVDWPEGLTRLVIGGRNIGFSTAAAWLGRIYRVVLRDQPPTAGQRQEILNWMDGTGPLPSGIAPPTPEQIFRATFADASGNPALQSALIRPGDVQALINHNVSLWAGRPGQWRGQPKWYRFTAQDIRIGDLHKTQPGQPIFVKKDVPGLRDGKWLLIMGRESDTSRPGPVTLLCMGWEPDDQ